MKEASAKNAAASQKANFLTNFVNPLIRLLTRLAHVVIAIIAGYEMINGRMSVGVVQAFFQYINQAAEPLTEASFMINSLQAALASAERTFEMLDEEEERPDTPYPVILREPKGQISFQHVSFGYQPGRLLMKDISFTAQPGQKIAIVNGGVISIDGVSTSDMTRKGLRSNFGMVLQDTWLFEGTVAENIAYGKADASREEIIDAAKAAKVDYFIRTMSHGYDTMLDNEASALSAGQRQLLTAMPTPSCSWTMETSSNKAVTKNC